MIAYILAGLVVCVLFTVWGVISGEAKICDETEDVPWFWVITLGATAVWPLTLFFLFYTGVRLVAEWVHSRVKEELEEHE